MTDLASPTVPAASACAASQRLSELRSRAAARLTGTAATKGPVARAADALSVLHALASSPATAADALALLHELQVHQVELELQAQELQESRAELETALRRQIALYDGQPVGCLTLDHRKLVHELNQTAADLLGIDRDAARGASIDSFLCADSARRLRSAMSSVDTGLRRAACSLVLRPRAGPELQVLAGVGADASANRYLLSLTPVTDEGPPPGVR